MLYQAEPLPDWCTGDGELSRARAEIAGLLADYNTLGWGSSADTALVQGINYTGGLAVRSSESASKAAVV